MPVNILAFLRCMIKDDNDDASFNDLIFDGKGSEGFQEDAVFDEEGRVFPAPHNLRRRCLIIHGGKGWLFLCIPKQLQKRYIDSFWCVLISAAAVMGVVIIGHHGHNKRLQVMQIK